MTARCEYCDVNLPNLNDARRHMLTITHVREKRGHELSQIKQIERLREASIVPKDLGELMKLLNIRSDEDIYNLDKASFFKISTNANAAICRHLIQIIHDNIVDYRVNSLPVAIRKPLFEAIESHKDHTNPIDDQS